MCYRRQRGRAAQQHGQWLAVANAKLLAEGNVYVAAVIVAIRIGEVHVGTVYAHCIAMRIYVPVYATELKRQHA